DQKEAGPEESQAYDETSSAIEEPLEEAARGIPDEAPACSAEGGRPASISRCRQAAPETVRSAYPARCERRRSLCPQKRRQPSRTRRGVVAQAAWPSSCRMSSARKAPMIPAAFCTGSPDQCPR